MTNTRAEATLKAIELFKNARRLEREYEHINRLLDKEVLQIPEADMPFYISQTTDKKNNASSPSYAPLRRHRIDVGPDLREQQIAVSVPDDCDCATYERDGSYWYVGGTRDDVILVLEAAGYKVVGYQRAF